MIKGTVELIDYGDPLKGAEIGTADSVQAILYKIEAQQKALCTVDTGTLRQSISNRISKGKDTVGEVGAGLLYPVDYAPYVEFGTKNMTAQPFIRPAGELVSKSGDAESIAKKYSNDAMERELKQRKVTVLSKVGK